LVPLSEINAFYRRNLRSRLHKIEQERNAVVQKMMRKFYLVVGVLFLLLLMSAGFEFILIAVFASFAWAAHFIYTRDYVNPAIASLNREYKAAVLKPLIEQMGQNVIVKANRHISRRDVKASNFFIDEADFELSGNDYAEADIDDVNVRFSDLLIQQQFASKPEPYVAFHGLFLVAEFNKRLEGTTIVQSGDNFFNTLAAHTFNVEKRKTITLENSAFNARFKVHSDSHIESRYILSFTMMERLLELRKGMKNITVSFSGNHLYLAIFNRKDNFELTLADPDRSNRMITRYIETLHRLFSIVDTLRLNEKLWYEAPDAPTGGYPEPSAQILESVRTPDGS
jgi:hypothetical protein